MVLKSDRLSGGGGGGDSRDLMIDRVLGDVVPAVREQVEIV